MIVLSGVPILKHFRVVFVTFVRASRHLSTCTSKFFVKSLFSLGGGTGRGGHEPLLTCSRICKY